MPVKFWVWLASIILTAFTLGYSASALFHNKIFGNQNDAEKLTEQTEWNFVVPSLGDGISNPKIGLEYMRANVVNEGKNYSMSLEVRLNNGRKFETKDIKGFVYDYSNNNLTYRLIVTAVNKDAASVEVSIKKL